MLRETRVLYGRVCPYFHKIHSTKHTTMLKGIKLLTLFLAAIVALSSCVSKKKFEELTSVKDNLSTELSKTQSELEATTKAKEETEAKLANETARMQGSIDNLESNLSQAQADLTKTKSDLDAKNKEFAEVKLAADGVFADYETKNVALTARGGNIVLEGFGPVYFNSGSVYLNKEVRESLEGLVGTLTANPEMKVMVVGHTDNQPVKPEASVGSNQRLSYLRAESVANYLMKKGVNAAQLSVAGEGDANPATAYTDDNEKEARKMNRRVEFVISPDLANLFAIPRG